MTDDVLQRLAALISARRAESASKSYTRELLDGGPERCAKKLGEEATETIIAALVQDNRRLDAGGGRSASITCWCCSRASASPSPTCWPSSRSRMGTSGLAEKAAREKKPQ